MYLGFTGGTAKGTVFSMGQNTYVLSIYCIYTADYIHNVISLSVHIGFTRGSTEGYIFSLGRN
jgi:hypothetical protein